MDCGASGEEVHKNTVLINEASERFGHGSNITDVCTSINTERRDTGGCAV